MEVLQQLVMVSVSISFLKLYWDMPSCELSPIETIFILIEMFRWSLARPTDRRMEERKGR